MDRKQLYRQRGLMTYPSDCPGDDLRFEAIGAVLERLDTPMVLTLPDFGARVAIDKDMDAKSAYLIATDDYEMADLVLMQAHVKPQDTALILGGGYGITAAVAARLTAPNPVVIVEAHRELHPRITHQVALNGSEAVLIHKAVVGDSQACLDGHIAFQLSDHIWFSRVGDGPGTINVPVTDLASLCAQFGPTVALMDIEGAEREVLTRPIPACLRLAIVEIHTPDFGGVETARIINAMMDQGFKLLDQISLVWVFERK